MALPGGMNMLSLIGLILLALGLVLHIVGLATPEWSVSNADLSMSEPDTDFRLGLFSACYRGACVEYASKGKPSELVACEAFALIGMLLAIAGLVLALLNVILGVMGKGQNKTFALLGGVCCLAAFGAVLTTVIIWGTDIHDSRFDDLGYSFALSVAGGILLLAAGGLVIAGGSQVSHVNRMESPGQ